MNKVLTTIVTFLLLYNCVSCTVNAQGVLPGVAEGDYFIYKFYTLWVSTSNASAPAEVQSLNQTERIKVMVTYVGGPFVVMNITRYFKNETVCWTQAMVHILNGTGNGFGLIIAPNLKPNDFAYPWGFQSGTAFKIMDSVIKKYAFGQREVLHAMVNQTGYDAYAYISHEMYYDRKTGVMLEWRTEQIPYADPTSKIVLVWEIVEFNVKGTGPSDGVVQLNEQEKLNNSILMITAVLSISIITVLLIYVRRKRVSLLRR